jgi:hypothetical protein
MVEPMDPPLSDGEINHIYNEIIMVAEADTAAKNPAQALFRAYDALARSDGASDASTRRCFEFLALFMRRYRPDAQLSLFEHFKQLLESWGIGVNDSQLDRTPSPPPTHYGVEDDISNQLVRGSLFSDDDTRPAIPEDETDLPLPLGTRNPPALISPGDAFSTSADKHRRSSSAQSQHGFPNAPAPLSAHPSGFDPSFLPPEFLQRSKEKLEDDAEAFYEGKTADRARNFMRVWKSTIAKQTQRELELEERLRRHQEKRSSKSGALSSPIKSMIDRLLQQSNQQGKSTREPPESLKQKKAKSRRQPESGHSSETEIIPDRATAKLLEERELKIGLVRREMLKERAFTHWINFAHENVDRTALARRHILRQRYFNAWKAITIISELKWRHFVLDKFFGKWYQRTVRHEELQLKTLHMAENARYQFLARASWRKLFRQFCLNRAHFWKTETRQRKALTQWFRRIHQIQEQETMALDYRRRRLLRSALNAWRSQWQKVRRLEDTATRFRTQNLAGHVIADWKAELPLLSRLVQLDQKITNSRAKTALATLQSRAHASRQAANTYKKNMLRHHFALWNDELRVSFIQNARDGRIAMDAFRTWLRTTNEIVFGRQLEVALQRRALLSWQSRSQQRREALDAALQSFNQNRQASIARRVLWKWLMIVGQRQQIDATALAKSDSKLLSLGFGKMRAKYSKIQLLKRKAEAADFYITARTSLKAWETATIHHQKLRRRELYAEMRRRVKTNLARKYLDLMREKTLGQQAEATYSRKLLVTSFERLREKRQRYQQLAITSRTFVASYANNSIISCFQKLRRRLFQVRGIEQWAQDRHKENLEKHAKSMIKYWADKTTHRFSVRPSVPPHDRDNDDDDDDDEEELHDPDADRLPGDATIHRRAAEWGSKAFEQGRELNLHLITPMPGYMRTPSKRLTARVNAREKLRALGATPAEETPAPDTVPSFKQRLLEKSINPRTSRGHSSSRRFGTFGSARRMTSPSKRVDFAGFDDIRE